MAMGRFERGSGGAWALVLGMAMAAGACRDDRPSGDGDDGSTGGDTDAPGDSTTADPDDTGDSTGEDTGDPPNPEDAVPPPGGLRRLLGPQYVASVGYLLGPDVVAAALAPEDPTLGTFDAFATLSSVPSVTDVEIYEDSAGDIANAALVYPQRLEQLVTCVGIGPFDDTCYEDLATKFGRLAWRRPLTPEQVERLVAVASSARDWDEDHRFSAGVEYMLTAILQSPYFLYLVEVGTPGEEHRELDAYELATRMSFFLLGRTPSQDLLERAEDGELDSDEGVRALAWELLEEPEARATVTRFFGELLTVRKLASKGKDPVLFPMFSSQLAASMLEETERLVDDVVFEEDTSILRLFDAPYTFVDGRLAQLYGMSAVAPGQWKQVELPPERAGVLSLSGWLTSNSHNRVNSPTRRGLYVMEQLLCTDVPLPPPDVNAQPITPAGGQTLRESLLQHMNDPACSACHAVMDPIGFGFERFNPVGVLQELDNGQPIDATGTLPGVGDFDGAAELAGLLVDDPRLGRCLVDRAYAGNLGFVPEAAMAPALDAVGLAFEAGDHNMKLLLVELTATPIFRLVDEPK
jgi:Protein of unknown function (DUF1592)/Protein of unknown function (DUF1588)/Protein of unknown function (DUF1595)